MTLHAWSPRRSPLQAHDTEVVVSDNESRMTRRSINHKNWSEGWEVQRILYARDMQTGDRKVLVVSFFSFLFGGVVFAHLGVWLWLF